MSTPNLLVRGTCVDVYGSEGWGFESLRARHCSPRSARFLFRALFFVRVVWPHSGRISVLGDVLGSAVEPVGVAVHVAGVQVPVQAQRRGVSVLRPVYTPPTARTGRLAGAQFPGCAVYALPTARTIRAIRAPDRAPFLLPGRPQKPAHELPEPDPAADAAAAGDVVIRSGTK
jgi:hypothetical protein